MRRSSRVCPEDSFDVGVETLRVDGDGAPVELHGAFRPPDRAATVPIRRGDRGSTVELGRTRAPPPSSARKSRLRGQTVRFGSARGAAPPAAPGDSGRQHRERFPGRQQARSDAGTPYAAHPGASPENGSRPTSPPPPAQRSTPRRCQIYERARRSCRASRTSIHTQLSSAPLRSRARLPTSTRCSIRSTSFASPATKPRNDEHSRHMFNARRWYAPEAVGRRPERAVAAHAEAHTDGTRPRPGRPHTKHRPTAGSGHRRNRLPMRKETRSYR